MELKSDVGIFDHFLSDNECDYFISLFKNKEKNGFTYNRQDSDGFDQLLKSDTSISIGYSDVAGEELERKNSIFVDKLWSEGVNQYGKYYPVLLRQYKQTYGYKIQKTIPGEGYHAWHCEKESAHNQSRILAFIVYLNDEFDGGETEFIHKNMRVTPKKGTLVVFPANFTHTHRGNPPLNGEKYIMAGWINIMDDRV